VFGIPMTKGSAGQSPNVEFFPELLGSDANSPPTSDLSSPLPPAGMIRVLRMQLDPSDLGASGGRFVQASVLSEEPL
jgi:hypothetical protein